MPGASVVSICNLALGRIGQGRQITSLTESSQAAASCAAAFDQVRDEVLTEFPWPFALRRVALAVVTENPSDDWAYSYRRPSDCLTARRVLSGMSRRSKPLVWEPGGDASGGLIFTDCQTAVLEYIARVENPAMYSPKFITALAWRLAEELAPVLQESPGFADVARRKYQEALSVAMAHASNEGVPDQESDGTFIEARTGGVTGTGEDWSAYPGGIRIS